jgi:hypothetical protein
MPVVKEAISPVNWLSLPKNGGKIT